MVFSYLTSLQGEGPVLPSHTPVPTWIHGSHMDWKFHGLNLHYLEREPRVPMCVWASSLLGICVQRCLQGECPHAVCQAKLMPLSLPVGSQVRAKGSHIQEGLEEGPHQECSQPGEVSPPWDTGMPRAQRQAATVGTDFLSLLSSGRWVVCRGVTARSS